MMAASTKAQVRAMLLGLRSCKWAPQRGQTMSADRLALLQRRWQLWQLINPEFCAVFKT
jgi:hypothetical protein